MAVRTRLLLVLVGVVTAATPTHAGAPEPRPAKKGEQGDAGKTRDDDGKGSRPGEPIIRAHEASPERPRTTDGTSVEQATPPPPARELQAQAAPPSPPPPRRIALSDTRAGLRSTPPPPPALVASGR